MSCYAPIELTDEEYAYLDQTIRRGHTAARIQSRARILLKCADGWTDKAIVEAIECSPQTVLNVRQRYETSMTLALQHTLGQPYQNDIVVSDSPLSVRILEK